MIPDDKKLNSLQSKSRSELNPVLKGMRRTSSSDEPALRTQRFKSEVAPNILGTSIKEEGSEAGTLSDSQSEENE